MKKAEITGASLELNFSQGQADVHDIDVSQIDQLIVQIPLPSFGVSNSHINLCRDLLVASWALERLAACAQRIEAKVGSGPFRPTITAILSGLQPQLDNAVEDCALLFTDDDVQALQRDRLDEICHQLDEYEDNLHAYLPRVPEVVDWYFANLVGGANYEWRSEAPEYYREQMVEFPERQIGYHRSAYSSLLGSDCYTSRKGWLLPCAAEIDRFFKVTDQKYRLSEFISAEILALGFQPLAAAEGVVAYFPMQQFLRSRICAGFVASKDPDDLDISPFDWLDQPFAPSPRMAEATPCLIHSTGTLLIVNDGSFQHLL